jgi:GNAT superfamily N-acetyltransferase
VVRPARAYPAALTAVGPPAAALDLALAVLPEVSHVSHMSQESTAQGGSGTAGTTGVRSLTLPRGAGTAGPCDRGASAVVLGPGVDWDWMWTQQPPVAVPAEDAVRDLDVTDPRTAGEVLSLLRSASPRHSAEPGDPYADRWVGVRNPDDGRLVACGACGDGVPGVPLLASIAVDPATRGRGLGAAVAAALTRGALADGAPVVTVDLYADNPVARRLYERLGFTLDQAFTSRPLPTPHPRA